MMIEHGQLERAGTYTLPNALTGWLLDEAAVAAMPPHTAHHRSGADHPAAMKPYVPPLRRDGQAKLEAQLRDAA